MIVERHQRENAFGKEYRARKVVSAGFQHKYYSATVFLIEKNRIHCINFSIDPKYGLKVLD